MTDTQSASDARLDTLHADVVALLGTGVAGTLATYAAALPRALDRAATADANLRMRILDQVEMMLAAFKVPTPNEDLIAELNANLRSVDAEVRRGLEGAIMRWIGGSPLWAALTGALMSVGVTVYLLSTLAFVFAQSATVRLDPLVFGIMAAGAMAGAVTSVLTRLNDFAVMGRAKIELVFLNAMVKPIVAVFLSVTVVALFTSDAVNIAGFDIQVGKIEPNAPDYLKQLAIFWSVGFLSGFSERFARDVVGRVDGAAAGPAQAGKSVS